MPADIFLSYASHDADFVTALSQQLTERGLSVWFDPDNDTLDLAHMAQVKQQIQACRVFILIESPAAVESAKTRGEAGTAVDNFAKPAILLKWQPAPTVPRPMQTLLNRLTLRVDFAGELSADNIERLLALLQRYIQPASSSSPPAPTTGRRLGALSSKAKATPTNSATLVFGAKILSNLVTPLDLAAEEVDFISGEIKWLFSTLDTLLKISGGQAEPNQSISEPIPPEAQRDSTATNQIRPTLLNNPDDFEDVVGEIRSQLTRLTSFLRELEHYSEQERLDGEAGKRDESLQANLKDARLKIAKLLQELAKQADAATGILITSPAELVEILEGRINPISLGVAIITNIVTPLELGAEDEAFVAGELTWLFSAASHHQHLFKATQRKLQEADLALKKNGLTGSQRETQLTERLAEIRQAELERSSPLTGDIPPDAERDAAASNRLVTLLDDDDLGFYLKLPLGSGLEAESSVRPLLTQLSIRLEALQHLTQRQAVMGEAGKRNVQLQNDIRAEIRAIVETMQRLARLMETAYQIYVTIPDQLAEQLDT
ncbi:MAG: toll/interleukin-1 receptor domain-containing protein [Anaerolineae bacterium]|nr:toll/interleukin-1 receptor domain-containing protein [Anaerolineae bacterium]